MNIIFLDIDGVISLDIDWCLDSINVLNEITKTTDSKFVISSDWKYHHSIDELKDIFKSQKITGEIIGLTENIMFRNSMTLEKDRASEINDYIRKNKIENYLVIDDLDLTKGGIDRTRFVKTKFSIGIKEKGLKNKCLKILTRKE